MKRNDTVGRDTIRDDTWPRLSAPFGLYSNDDIDFDDIALGFHVVESDEDSDEAHDVREGQVA